MTIGFRCKITIEDLVAFNENVARRLGTGGVDWQRLIVSLGPGLLLGLIFWRESAVGSLVFGGTVAILVFLAWPAVRRSSLEKTVRRIHIKDTDPSVLGTQEYRFSETGIEARFATGHALYEWANIIDVAETDKHVFIYLSPVKAVIVPKNETLDGATGSEIVTRVRERIAANA